MSAGFKYSKNPEIAKPPPLPDHFPSSDATFAPAKQTKTVAYSKTDLEGAYKDISGEQGLYDPTALDAAPLTEDVLKFSLGSYMTKPYDSAVGLSQALPAMHQKLTKMYENFQGGLGQFTTNMQSNMTTYGIAEDDSSAQPT
jgi:hypothetical protein